MQKARFLLERLTEKMPPGEGQRHNLTLDGQALELTLMFGHRYIPIRIKGTDFIKPIKDLVDEICELASSSLMEDGPCPDDFSPFLFSPEELARIASKAEFMACGDDVRFLWRLAYQALSSAAAHLSLMIEMAMLEDAEDNG